MQQRDSTVTQNNSIVYFYLTLAGACVYMSGHMLLQSLRASLLSHCAKITRDSPNLIVTPVNVLITHMNGARILAIIATWCLSDDTCSVLSKVVIKTTSQSLAT